MLKMICGIYKIYSASGNCYIGSSKRIGKRLYDHFHMLKTGCHKNKALTRAYLKYGGLKAKILLICAEKDLLFYEQLLLDAFKPVYNGSKLAGKIDFTPEILAKMSAARKGKRRPETSVAKTAAANRGQRRTAEVKAKMSISAKARGYNRPGYRPSEETKLKMSKAALGNQRFLGRKHSEETKRKISLSALGHKRNIGRACSEETKRKISESHKARWKNVSVKI